MWEGRELLIAACDVACVEALALELAEGAAEHREGERLLVRRALAEPEAEAAVGEQTEEGVRSSEEAETSSNRPEDRERRDEVREAPAMSEEARDETVPRRPPPPRALERRGDLSSASHLMSNETVPLVGSGQASQAAQPAEGRGRGDEM